MDVKPKFKLQIEDRDKVTGAYLFQPTFHEHHRSYLRQVFSPEQNLKSETTLVSGITDLIFYGVQGQNVSKEDFDLVNKMSGNSEDKNIGIPTVENVKILFEEKDIMQNNVTLKDCLPPKRDRKTAVCLDLTSLKAGYAPGVSEPNAVFGLTLENIEGAVNQLTESGKDDLVIISEYNPAIEKHKTGETMVHIFKWLL